MHGDGRTGHERRNEDPGNTLLLMTTGTGAFFVSLLHKYGITFTEFAEQPLVMTFALVHEAAASSPTEGAAVIASPVIAVLMLQLLFGIRG